MEYEKGFKLASSLVHLRVPISWKYNDYTSHKIYILSAKKNKKWSSRPSTSVTRLHVHVQAIVLFSTFAMLNFIN